MRSGRALLVAVLVIVTALPWSASPALAATVVFRPAGFGFEQPTLPAGTVRNDVSTMAWTFTGTAGIATQGSSLVGRAAPVPQGTQVAHITDGGRIARPLGVKKGDVVRLTATQRRTGNTSNQVIGVYVDGDLQGRITPSTTSWSVHRIRLDVDGEGAVTLELRGTAAAGQSRVALVDAVVVERVGWTVQRPAYVTPGPRLYTIPAGGLPGERRSLMSRTTEVLEAGVVGLLTAGDSEPEIQTQVLAIAEWKNRIYIGGKFSHVQRGNGAAPVSQPYLAAFDRVTGAWIDTFRPRLDGTVWDLAVTSTGALVVGGQFTEVNNASRTTALAALDPETGAVLPGWRADVTSSRDERAMVRAIDVSGDWIYIGGTFDRIVGGAGGVDASVSNLARVTVSDGRPSVAAFTPRIEGSVIDIDATADRIYAVGHIWRVNGEFRSSLAVLNPTDGTQIAGTKPVVQTSTYGRNHYMQGVLAVGGDVWLNGSQHATQVYRRSDLRLVRSWVNEPFGDGQALATVNGYMYSGSHANRRTYVYTDVASWPPVEPGTRTDAIAWIGAWDIASRTYTPTWIPDVGSRVGEGAWELFVDSRRCLWAGGDFNRGSTVRGASRFAQGFAKFCPVDDVLPTTPGTPTRAAAATGVRLAWTASTDAGGAVTYQVLRNDRVLVSGLTALTYVDTGGTARDIYVVRAVDPAGNISASTVRL